MKNRWRWLSAALAGLVLICAGAAVAVDTRGGDQVAVSGDFTDMVFAAGGDVTLSMNATDDVFATGGDIVVRSAKLDDAFIAGGDLSFENVTVRDLVAAGGEVDVLSGEILDDLVAAGGRIDLAPDVKINGAVMLAGAELTIDAPIGAGLHASGDEINLNSEITGDVFLEGRRIVVGPQARIHGALTHRGRHVEIDPAAQVDGEVTALPPRPETNFRRFEQMMQWAGYSIAAGLVLLGLLVALVLPRLLNDVAAIACDYPLSMLGFGLLLMIFAPILIVLLLFTIFGIPIGLFILAAFSFMWMLAFVSAAYALAMWLREHVQHEDTAPNLGARAFWIVATMAALVLISFIPFAGPVICFGVTLVGLGAVALQITRALALRPATPAS